ncbi:hypothetical protein SDC9_82293 [bioreactor metagenome]|uniref:Uncharacterized protein n=1 Tax=bioreactor metagenome TaxID=1076179 RepID=A0A644Z486_9ZZZZ
MISVRLGDPPALLKGKYRKVGIYVREDVVYSIEERLQIRRDAETILETAGVGSGSVTLVQGASMYHLISVLLKAGVPLWATTYDLADFQLAHISKSQQNLLRLTDDEKVTRVFEPENGLVLRFPETVGQAPVLYVSVKARPALSSLKLCQFQLPEWFSPVEYHLAFLDSEGFTVRQEEVEKYLLKQMLGETTPPEVYSYLSKGIGLVIHVAPKTFSYRFPEFTLEHVAHWPMDELQNELEEMMLRLRQYRTFSEDR